MPVPLVSTAYAPANWSTNREGAAIVAIIAHNTVGVDSRAYLKRGGDRPDGSDRKVSIHVLIQKDGTIYRYLEDTRGANHAGYGMMPAPHQAINPNRCTLSFELENASDGISKFEPYPEAQLLSMGWQINDWRRLHGPLPIYRHRDIDPTRRKDPVSLSVRQIEEWCTKAAAHFGVDEFTEWGPIGVPQGEARGWAIPKLWLAHKALLGPCKMGETYLTSTVSVAVFQYGLIYYSAATHKAEMKVF